MSKYLKSLIEVARGSNIEIHATGHGLSIVIQHGHGTTSEPVTKSISFWIDKNDKDMEGRLEHFLKLARKP